MAVIPEPERSQLYTRLRHLLGAPLRSVELEDEQFDSLQGKSFYDKVLEVMNESSAPRASKVSESRPTGQSGGSSGRSYASLPADAREACDRQGKKLVGEGRAFKDMSAWRSYYTKLFYEGEEQ